MTSTCACESDLEAGLGHFEALKWTQTEFISIDAGQERPFFDWHWQVIRNTRNLLTLCVGEPVYPRIIQLHHAPNAGEEHTASPILVYFRDTERNQTRDRHPIEMLAAFPEIQDELLQSLNAWFSNADKLKNVYTLFFGTFYTSGMYVESEFLRMMQAVESFHRSMYPGTYLTTQKYEAVVEQLYAAIPATIPQQAGAVQPPELVPASLKQSLKSRIKYGNEFSLRKRIGDIFQSIGPQLVGELTQNADEFIEKTVGARNILTHYSEELEQHAYSGTELWELSKRLEVLVAILLLKTIGVTEAKIRQMIQRKYGYTLRRRA